MRKLFGSAELRLKRELKKVNIAVDLRKGIVVVSVPDDEFSGSVRLHLWFRAHAEPLNLHNVTIETAGGTLHAQTIGPFFFSYINTTPGTDSALDASMLGSMLAESTEMLGISEFRLTPENSRIDFELKTNSEPSGSEIYFYYPYHRSMDFSATTSSISGSVHLFAAGSSLADYVLVRCDQAGLTRKVYELGVGLSLLFRRRVFHHVAREGSIVAFNLARPDQTTSFGHLVEPEHLGSAFESLLEFVTSQREGTSRAANHFLVEAFSSPGTLEARLLNAFVYLEIVDGSRRLSVNELSRALDISRRDADVIKVVRNRMIHDGLGIVDALEYARADGRAKKRADDKLDILDKVYQTDHPAGHFYSALMDALSLYLAAAAGISSKWIRRRGLVAFREWVEG